MDEKKCFIMFVIGCLIIFYGGFVLGGGSISDLFRGTEPVRQELDRAEEYQRQAEDRVRDIEATTGGVTGAIESGRKAVTDAQGTAGRIEADNGRAGAIIAECQQIIAAVRARGKVKAAAQ